MVHSSTERTAAHLTAKYVHCLPNGTLTRPRTERAIETRSSTEPFSLNEYMCTQQRDGHYCCMINWPDQAKVRQESCSRTSDRSIRRPAVDCLLMPSQALQKLQQRLSLTVTLPTIAMQVQGLLAKECAARQPYVMASLIKLSLLGSNTERDDTLVPKRW